jgi:hypothetical protein
MVVPKLCMRLLSLLLGRNAADRGFDPRSGQTKDYKIGICWFSAKQTPLRWSSKDWLTRNQDNVSEWGNMFTHELLSHIMWWSLLMTSSRSWFCVGTPVSTTNWPPRYSRNIGESGVQHQLSISLAILWREQVNFQWDDDEVCFVLD